MGTFSIMTFSIITVSITLGDECYYADFRSFVNCMLHVIQNAIVLSVMRPRAYYAKM